jgi:hypothetical protein
MMHYASKTWWEVQPKLTTTTYAVAPKTMTANSLTTQAAPQVETSNAIMRGGQVNGTVSDSFTLESGLSNGTFDVMTSSAATDVTLTSPSGKTYKASHKGAATNADSSLLFSKAMHHYFSIPTPEKGDWKVQVTGQNDAYFMYGTVDGGAVAKVKGEKKVLQQDDHYVKFNVAFDGGKANKKVKAKLTKARKNGRNTNLQDIDLQTDGNGGLASTFVKPTEPGVYNVSFDVTGTNDKGELFTRSVNYNFAVTDASGHLPKN